MTQSNNAATTGQQASAGRSSGLTQKSGSTRTLQTVRDPDGQVTSRVRRTLLPGGLRVISEQMAGVRSASIGVWVGVGSRDETPTLHGCSHFLEHLLFKGTAERSALDISIALDAVGGEFNAFTAKEYTCFHARVLDEDLGLAVDVIGDMITSSTITDADVEAERDVILDEIAMHDDDPDDVVHNLFAQQAWGDSPLGRPIAGTDASITALTPAQIKRFYARHYRPANMVVSAAGNVDHAALVRMVRKAFGRNGWLDREESPVPPRHGRTRRVSPGEVHATRPFEQVNVVLGMEGLTRQDERRFALGVLNTALGGGTSSRLFQEVREHRGLAYSVSPSPATTPTPASSGSPWAACPASSTTCSPWCGPSSPRSPRRASPPRSSPVARARCAGDWCWAWRTPARGCRGWARPSLSTTSCWRSTR